MMNDPFGIKDKQMNEAVLASMPKNPERGSYWWWARLCREYSGASMLDSGSAYGRMHAAPMPGPDSPTIAVHVYNGGLDYATVSLPHWLTSILDGGDEKAEAFEKLLYWASDNLWPKETWGSCIQQFPDILNTITAHCYKVGSAKDYFSWKDLALLTKRDSRFRVVGDATAEEAVKSFPRSAFMKLEGESWAKNVSGYTYNHDNDFSQDFVYQLIAPESGSRNDLYDTELCIIQTHNGCDARGGFSSPRVATVKDIDYFFDWRVRLYGSNDSGCDDYDGIYWYSKAMKDPNFPDANMFDAYLKHEFDEPLPGFSKPEPPFSYPLLHDLAKEYERQRAESEADFDKPFVPDDFNWPHLIIGNDEAGYEFPDPDAGYESFDAATVSFWSPKLQSYCVYCQHAVDGW